MFPFCHSHSHENTWFVACFLLKLVEIELVWLKYSSFLNFQRHVFRIRLPHEKGSDTNSITCLGSCIMNVWQEWRAGITTKPKLAFLADVLVVVDWLFTRTSFGLTSSPRARSRRGTRWGRDRKHEGIQAGACPQVSAQAEREDAFI